MNRPKMLTAIISGFALAFSALWFPVSHQAQTAAHIKGRALLVGVSQYQQHPAVKPTRGAEDDASETAKFIQTQYGFHQDEIHTLIGPQATAANIKAEFRRWLIEGTQPGDRVFFLYAGHGSRIKDTNNDEADGYDEVLAPYDVNWRGDGFVNIVSDDELGKLIGQLSGRLAVLVFDSCNSGTISRGTPGASSISAAGDARYLPSPEEAAKLGLGVTTRGGAPVEYFVSDDRILTTKSGSPAKQQERDLNVLDIGAQDTATGIVVISAAQSTQTAFSMDTGGGKYRGALSYVFSEAQGERLLTLRQLQGEITQGIDRLQRAGRLKGNQKPSFEVISTVPLDDKPLFADTLTVPMVALTNPQSAVKLSLRTRENKTVYRFGETVSYHFTTDTQGYLYLIVFSEKDVATCIFPNANLGPNANISDNWLKAGSHVITRDGREGFYVGEPEGKDVVVALLSATKLELGGKREEYSWGEVFKLLSNRRFSEYVRTRGQTSQKPAELTNWHAASLVLQAVR